MWIWQVANRSKKILSAAALTIIAVLSLFVVHFASTPLPPDDRPDQASNTTRDRIVDIAVARIAAESRGSQPEPLSEAAPREFRGQSSIAADVPSRTAPDGYSFVDHHGEMAKAQIEGPRPPGEERPDGPAWLRSPGVIAALSEQAATAGRDWSFGWIRIADNATRDDIARSLEGTGAEIVGSTGRMVRAKLPASTTLLRTIAMLPGVDGIGAAPAAMKLRAFEDDPLDWPVHEQRPAYITLMAHDGDGRWRRALEDLGAVVGGYDPDIRVYKANVSQDMLGALSAVDFVLAVEPIRVVEALHDTAVPAMGADALRAHRGSPGIFAGTGGASVPIAVMDTGLNINHLDIASHRDSICGANFAYNSGWFGPEGALLEAEDLWIDENGHGTHVTGTIAGNGYLDSRFAGMAPAVRHIRFAKVLDSYGFGSGDGVVRGMDYLSNPSQCSERGSMSSLVKPLIVNMSLSASKRIFEGRDVGARKLDSTVWSHRQLYVVAQSNEGISGFSNYGAAKNSLAVGAVLDSGEAASFTSHGPTADGRLAPNIVATGVVVHSAVGGGNRGGYVAFSGTSTASPATAGVAALLMDAVPAHKEQPALTRARLMASAIRPDPWLADAPAFPSNNSDGPGAMQAVYGMGKVSARTVVLDRDQPDGWKNGSATTELADGQHAYQDIDVPEGASRLDLVMTWDEPPAEAIASTVLNDLDLWLDRDADCETSACGEHVSASRTDNVEWIILRNPEPGTYRAKVLAHRVYTAAPRAALAWTVIRGASTPTLGITADTESFAGEGSHEITLTLSSDGYVAAGTRLHIDCRDVEESLGCGQLSLRTVTVTREDGISVDLSNETQGFGLVGVSVPIGEIAVGENREVTFVVSLASDSGNAHLHFRANAWNAQAASVAVRVGTGDITEPVSEEPANDDFSTASSINGDEGSRALDLLHATPEPGEPVFSSFLGRPASSVWYEWIASTNGPVEFQISSHNPSIAVDSNHRVDIFRGDRITSLEAVASGRSGTIFFAEQGTVYRVRVSSSSRGTALDLRWSPGGRPANDDFARAAVLEGESGELEGSSAGATLEPGESFGAAAATTWFRWTAPEDGDWWFSVASSHQVLAFEGDSPATLRLLSGRPESSALLAARRDREYRIVVADSDARGPPGPYELSWRSEHRDTGNDRFADAASIGSASSSEYVVDVDSASTVEPDEPLDTGVRTKWWAWEAPADGFYTWRLEDTGEAVPTYPKLRLTVFAGTGIEDLELVAETGPGAPFDFLLDAAAGQSYWIAVGFPTGDVAAYVQRSASAKLIWGPTPANDDTADAAALSGISGSISGSNKFATATRGERTDIVGRSTLWWTYEAPASGWVGFAVDEEGSWAITIYREDGSGGLDIVASSRWQRVDGEVLFQATEGVRYTIALGVRGGGRGGEFTLRWDKSEAPVWLRYAGRMADGQRDSRGNQVEIRGTGDLVFHESGDALYLASELGLQVFERESTTGELNYLQSLESDLDFSRAHLIWDPHRDRLLVDDCGTWHSFARVGESAELEDRGEMAVADDPSPCIYGEDLLMSADGAHLYRISQRQLHAFTVEDSGGIRFADMHDFGAAVQTAVFSNSGDHIYAVFFGSSTLGVFEWDADSGMLTQADFAPSILLPDSQSPLAISEDDAYLFVFDGSGGHRTNVFSLEDPLNPQKLATLSRFWDWPPEWQSCRFADIRSGVVADGGVVVDVFCSGFIFSVLWDPTTSEIHGIVNAGQVDRFNGVPTPDFGWPTRLAVSPDGRHVYLSTRSQGILIFDRGGPVQKGNEQESDVPDLVIQSTWASPPSPLAGEAFTLNAVVRNKGTGDSQNATLRFYRSADTTIERTDTEVGSVLLEALAASDTSGRFVAVTAPSDAGTYHYGACVDDVADESDTTNNCSGSVTVEVSAKQSDPDLVVESPAVSNTSPTAGAAFTLSAVVRNRANDTSTATTLRYYRSTDETISGSDVELGTDSVAALAAGTASEHSISLTAPSDAGTYRYGACVDDVADESDAANNCSAAVGITITGSDSS